VLATDLRVDSQKRAAAPAWSEHALVLDPSPPISPAEYAARAAHHEFYHMLDYADSSRALAISEWSRANPNSFRYGSGGRTAYDDPRDNYSIRHPSNGFITLYATAGLEEDRAEVFSTLVVMPMRILAEAGSDSVLSHKIELVRQHLARMCPSFVGRV
jgi:hypothetical protein